MIYYLAFCQECVPQTGRKNTSRTMEGYYEESKLLTFVAFLLERGMTKSKLRIEAGFTTTVLANMNKGQHISMESLIRICDALDCGLNDVVELVKAEEQ